MVSWLQVIERIIVMSLKHYYVVTSTTKEGQKVYLKSNFGKQDKNTLGAKQYVGIIWTGSFGKAKHYFSMDTAKAVAKSVKGEVEEINR